MAFAALAILPLGLIVADTVSAQKKSSAARKRPSKRRTTASKAKPRQTWRTRQAQPTLQRYKEIQQALANKGYLAGEPAGVWGQDSVDALRRFQQDQNLDATGKIDSLSLIALGLGPKRQAASAAPAARPPQQETPPAPPQSN
jgi:peptidoglycan hydrolase-like protein with peptidoglycan-binding domain